MPLYPHGCIPDLVHAGIDYDDAYALRRIAMTLHRWHELECGDSNQHCSFGIERDGDNGDGAPYMVQHWNHRDKPTRHRIPDREKGAHKRLAKIMTRYPGWQAYVQGDPRGCALYVLRPGDVPEGETSLDRWYVRGIAVYK